MIWGSVRGIFYLDFLWRIFKGPTLNFVGFVFRKFWLLLTFPKDLLVVIRANPGEALPVGFRGTKATQRLSEHEHDLQSFYSNPAAFPHPWVRGDRVWRPVGARQSYIKAKGGYVFFFSLWTSQCSPPWKLYRHRQNLHQQNIRWQYHHFAFCLFTRKQLIMNAQFFQSNLAQIPFVGFLLREKKKMLCQEEWFSWYPIYSKYINLFFIY